MTCQYFPQQPDSSEITGSRAKSIWFPSYDKRQLYQKYLNNWLYFSPDENIKILTMIIFLFFTFPTFSPFQRLILFCLSTCNTYNMNKKCIHYYYHSQEKVQRFIFRNHPLSDILRPDCEKWECMKKKFHSCMCHSVTAIRRWWWCVMSVHS